MQLYRDSFRPSEALPEPYVMLGAAVICAETDERARWLAGPSGLQFASLRRGRPIPLPTPEEAAEYAYSALDRQLVDERLATTIHGSPSTVRKGLEALIGDTGADEIMITTMVHGAADRVRSYELVAQLASE
ncbi:alkanesulfonate monooxygenase SsuD/methylene tetrahydromethanopterin reductase-like flavin-dependent oxidoreductase (luciferase family) [Amycolatopsis thermophila]|uniref:Alkanesulfonate monooxygenase SsuD/methylene tetrahydromethanopterin reductase-like flavin-dependent oxidoreductase (Luciferase family) n=1 Tax=Amycolatopsis thermophila TaxID=206084 RepID=A0ABU0ENB9_9PSEU|nr:alkanesulfonate monooxygenase SsuD/methylene tetrahydromethanopterin reductase-like flavin-dependent oxidoreductase (luciferase family) [Amycolatopsis thermophila]